MGLKRSFVIYTASSILASALPLALLPMMTRELSTAEYGIVATMTTLIAFFTPPMIWGAPSLVAVEHSKLDAAQFRNFLTSVLVIPLVSLLLCSAIAAVAAPWVAPHLEVPAVWFAAVPLMAALGVLPQVLSAVLRMRNAAFSFGVLELTTAASTVLLSLLFVVGLHWHWQGRMYAYLLTSGLMSLVAAGWLLRHGFLRSGAIRPYVRESLRFGAGLLPHDLGNQAIRLADRLFLVTMVGLAGAGQYAVAAQVTGVVMVAMAAFNRAWAPYLFPRLQDATPETRREIVRMSYLIIAGFAVFFVLFNLAAPHAYRFFIDPKFHPSLAYVGWLTVGYFFSSIYMTYIDYIFYVKKTHVLSVITSLNMAINLSLNYVLIGAFGPIGAAYAFAATMFIVMLLAFFLSNKLFPMPWFYWLRRAAS